MGAALRNFQSAYKLLHKTLLSTLLAVFCLFGLAAKAHDLSPAIVDLEITEDRIDIRIIGSIEPMILGYDLSERIEIGDGPEDGPYRDLRAQPEAVFLEELKKAWPDMTADMTLLVNGEELDLELGEVITIDPGDLELPREAAINATARFDGPNPIVRFGWDMRLGYMVLRQVGAGDEGFGGILPLGDLSPQLTRGASDVSALETFVNYIIVGFDHIVPKGLDHILFVLGLFFFSLNFRPLLWQVTTFTVAHTITLALASLQIVNLPASIVEPLIALSIVYVAIENIFGDGKTHARRLVIIFFFGLLHGLGFASVLSDFGLNPAQFISGLIGFNIGVEFGQLAVIAVAFLAVGLWFGPKPWYKSYIANPASLLIAAVGAYWTIERVFL
ncbi:MAG: HupE/UreJ family protein [Pseudomonadota bacterium]